MEYLIDILNTDNELNIIQIMGHRQDMTSEQRLQWDIENYRKRLEANKGSNYQYWNDNHQKLLENGWELFEFRDIDQRTEHSTRYETKAKEAVDKLRSKGNYSRIVCGYDKNKLRIKTYSVIFKKK